MTPQSEALRLIEEALKELESPKGSVLAGVQKLSRASTLTERFDIQKWCVIQLGDKKYTTALERLISALTTKDKITSELDPEEVKAAHGELAKLSLEQSIH